MMSYIQRLRAWSKRPNKSIIMQYVETFIVVLPIAFFIRTYFYGLYQVPTGSMETTMLVGDRFFADKLTVFFYPPKHGDIITFNDPTFPYSDNSFINWYQRYVWGPSNWTKRLVACPGDHIKGVIEEGKPVVYLKKKGETEFTKLHEPYLNKYPLVAVYQPECGRAWANKSYDPAFSFQDQPFYYMKKQDVELAKKILALHGRPSLLEPQTPAINDDGRNVDIYDFLLGENEYWAMGDNRLGSCDCRFWGGTQGKPLDGILIHGKIIFRLWSIDSDDSWWIVDLLKHPIDFWKRVRWSRFFQQVN